ncbi:putative uncharacterized protein DDB_G0271606 isoform X2 [Toxorhynchites rutilus septentrionalis]|uniref:putative uncharacterized protein DDB_G0271606 isoform X2 n=1 Tax=Toxorhynchites rutilus septentrionalis TaxID=329112 RepID=UPI002478E4C8|nr:putative uncharacterized protein DDB_G0271606 isoform X2 [Toxorhynchites rutilus septentrionalis]
MGDTKVKQPSFFGSSPQQQATTSKAALLDAQKGNPALKVNGKEDGSGRNVSKYDQLKARKMELERRLNEKYAQLQQIKREEAQLIGMYPSDFSAGVGSHDQNGAAPTLRRKIGTSFKLPENLLNNKEDDINKLLLEKQIQQQISEASLRLANDTSQSKSVRRTHKQNYETAQQKLLAINQNLSVLKKRQQTAAEQQKPPPATRDDIDLHKSNNVNRFRSNSNSSSMMMMNLSERRNSLKSNTSSNHSSTLNSSIGSASKQQQLLVQIPSQHPGHFHSQQLSPYSLHSGALSVMPSGSQSMTPSASAAMVSQLSMLRQRPRHDSFSGIINYDTTSVDAAKMSPQQLQHQQQQQQQQQQGSRLNKLMQHQILNYSPPPGHHPHGYILSPPASASSAATSQSFVYDSKVISRLQQPPPPPPPPSHVPTSFHEQHYYPNTQASGSNSSYEPQQDMTAGLGGYWMMLETGEKVWCAVDARFSSLDRKSGGSMKLSRSKLSQYQHAIPTKSNSMGNFDFVNKQQQQQQQQEDSIHSDAISVTSGSSEHKKREKIWRETSLDSPIVKHKTIPSPTAPVNTTTLPAYPQPPPAPTQVQVSIQTPLHINTSHNYGISSSSPLLLSPQQMRYYQQKQQQILEQQRQQQYRMKQIEEQNHHAYVMEQHQQQQQQQHLHRQKLLRSPPHLPNHRNPYTQQVQQPVNHQHQHQHLDLLPQSPQLYDRENNNYFQSQGPPRQSNLSSRHPDLLISPTLSVSSSNTLTSPNLRHQTSISPTPSTITTTSTGAGVIIQHTPDIQTESPKNVTVVQQGKILPYKEVTKPFEMSDFYKYSTKYRQKQQQLQQQQHQQPSAAVVVGQLSPNGNSVGLYSHHVASSHGSGSSAGEEMIQKATYHPPNPSICHAINYN